MFGGSEKIGRIGMMGDHRDTFRSFRSIVIHSDPSDPERHHGVWVDGQSDAKMPSEIKQIPHCSGIESFGLSR